MELSRGRVCLRAPVEADAEGVAEAVQSSLAELEPWMTWASTSYDASMALAWIRGEYGDAHRFVIVDDAGAVIGSCGLNHVDDVNRSANLGYWIRTDRTGLGHATEAARNLGRFGLGEAGYQRLEIVMSTRNHASRRVAEKAGATHEGVARSRLLLRGEFHDAHVWSLVAGDL